MEKDIYKRCIEKFGSESQFFMAIEEMAELTKELSKFKRYGNNVENITEEMADVYIMMEQLKTVFNNEKEIEEVIEYKLNKLDTLIYLHDLKKETEITGYGELGKN